MADRDVFDDLRAAYGSFEPSEPTDAQDGTDEAIAAWMRSAYDAVEPKARPRPLPDSSRGRRFAPWLIVASAVAAGLLLWVRSSEPTPEPGPPPHVTVAVAKETNTPVEHPDVAEETATRPRLLATRPREDGLEVVSGPVRLLLIAPVSGAEGASFPEEDR